MPLSVSADKVAGGGEEVLGIRTAVAGQCEGRTVEVVDRRQFRVEDLDIAIQHNRRTAFDEGRIAVEGYQRSKPVSSVPSLL